MLLAKNMYSCKNESVKTLPSRRFFYYFRLCCVKCNIKIRLAYLPLLKIMPLFFTELPDYIYYEHEKTERINKPQKFLGVLKIVPGYLSALSKHERSRTT